MGTSVQTVTWPVRKFARVGLPLRRSASSERMSSQLRVPAATVSSVASPTNSSSSAVSWARCEASPGVVANQRISEVGQRGGPLRHRAQAGERVETRLQALQELGQPSRQVDIATVHVVERERGAEETLPLLGHRHPEQNPVKPRLTRAARSPLQSERVPVRGASKPQRTQRLVHPIPPAGTGRRR